MAARPPASHRPPSTDARSPRPSPAALARLRTLADSEPSSDDDDDHELLRTATRHVPTRSSRHDERSRHTSYRVPSPPYQHTRRPLLPDDALDDDEAPYVPSLSRDLPRIEPLRRDLPDDALAAAQRLTRSPRRAQTLDGARMHASRLEGGSAAGRRAMSDDEGESHRAERLRESPRAARAGEEIWSRNITETPASRAPSGTNASSQHRPAMPSDEPFTPLVPPPHPMYPQPNAALPVFSFNRERYPAYDVHARRIGLEHTRMDTTPAQPGSYYRPRTKFYPGPETSASEYPHVMSIELASAPTGNAASRSARLPDLQAPHLSGPAVPPASLPAADPSTHRPSRRLRTPPSAVEELPEDRFSSSPPAEPAPEVDADGNLETDAPAGPAVNTTPYLRDMLGLEPDEEVSLRALADPVPGEKPNYPYPTLIKLAIHGSANKRLTLQEIYLALEERFQWYKDNADDKSWQNSIRHNLSLNKCFRRVARPITEPGKGSFWVVDYSQGTGNKRERKRNKKPTKAQLRRQAAEEAARALAAEGGYDSQSPLPTPTSRPASAFMGILQLPPLTDVGRGSEGGHSGARSPSGLSPSVECAYGGGAPRSESRSSRGTPAAVSCVDDSHIDPQLRDTSHVVGEGRSRAPAPSRRTSSPYLPVAQIRQSARITRRQNTYDRRPSRSPSPRASSSSMRGSAGPFPRSGYSQTSPTTYEPPPTHAGRPPPEFGHASLTVATQYTVPAPHNWPPYAPALAPTQSHRALRSSGSGSTQPGNALMLAGVPTDPSTYAQPVASSSSSSRPTRSAPRRDYRDRGPSSSRRRSGSGRRVYTDSRGNTYPAKGRSGDSSSGSE